MLNSKLTFVDLAGSEGSSSDSAANGETSKLQKEVMQQQQLAMQSRNINQGLLSLGRVINGIIDLQDLSAKNGGGGAAAVRVPYRDSTLTHLLKDALGGNSQTLFLACVSPAASNADATKSTLTVIFHCMLKSRSAYHH